MEELQTLAVYKHGPTNLATREPSMLNWTKDNRLRLVGFDQTTKQEREIFNVAPQEVQKFSGAMASIVIMVAGKKYRLDLIGDPASAQSNITPADIVIDQHIQYKRARVSSWVERFKTASVKTVYLTPAMTWLVAIGVTVVICVVVAIIVFVIN